MPTLHNNLTLVQEDLLTTPCRGRSAHACCHVPGFTATDVLYLGTIGHVVAIGELLSSETSEAHVMAASGYTC